MICIGVSACRLSGMFLGLSMSRPLDYVLGTDDRNNAAVDDRVPVVARLFSIIVGQIDIAEKLKGYNELQLVKSTLIISRTTRCQG